MMNPGSGAGISYKSDDSNKGTIIVPERVATNSSDIPIKMRSKPLDATESEKSAVDGGNKEPKLHNTGSDFIAPDGGWGWMVVIASGFSNLCTFPVLQQFGLLLRERMSELSISSSEVTTIINTHSALTSIIGLANGPMFRLFSYRQVAFFGALLVGIAVTLTSQANSFTAYMITFAILYGSGVGINASANSLALNTYFKQRRRIATGFAWTLTGLGPIIAPHLITFLQRHFGTNGTILLFGGFAMNASAFALLYQPVHWHARAPAPAVDDRNLPTTPVPSARCSFCQSGHNPSAEVEVPLNTVPITREAEDLFAYDSVVETGTPMLSHSNDGWYSRSSLYGSRLSLSTPRNRSVRQSIVTLGDVRTYTASGTGAVRKESINFAIDECHTEDCPIVQAEHEPLRRGVAEQTAADLGRTKALPAAADAVSGLENSNSHEKTPKETDVLVQASTILAQLVENSKQTCTCSEALKCLAMNDSLPEAEPTSLLQRIVIFFDLDLLRDTVYLNIMVGITLANFAELNFSILTPFVLADFGCSRDQIAMAMSALGAMDISSRCLVPLLAERINWQNRTFFLIGVMNMALGRIVLAHFHSYPVILCVACWIGFNKGLRTVFMALAIPSHVSLERLPGATGIHLLFAGLFYLFIGPLVGYVRDATNYATTLHVLNLATYTMAICWTLEMYYFTPRQRQRKVTSYSLS